MEGAQRTTEEKRRQREEAHAAQAAPETVQGPAPRRLLTRRPSWEQHDDATQVIPAYRPTEHEGSSTMPRCGARRLTRRRTSAGAPGRGERAHDAAARTRRVHHQAFAAAACAPSPDEQRQRTVIAQKAAAIEAATSSYQQPARYEFADDEEDLYTYIPPYNLPSRDPDPEPERWDLYRRIAVSLGALSAIFSTLWMFGVFTPASSGILGGQLRQTWLDGDFALLSPERSWYWIWPVITVGLIAHAIFQWQASQESTPRQRHSGWLVAYAGVLMVPSRCRSTISG
ncbi:hypothetical protein [Nesterenkonia pannonica]|uniref:hypothetical protein n=1 Tax=Nesterenkonia pannonica TaxID=1548602 RepID=UPI002164EE71|nr:hypothetical protein [Nesterenkonia pannonica]